ncbi:MAG: serine/threonine protein kinase [Labilithrix sp.]|nr:serine/threonine protein kinase [Labilithrix sp.]MBX3225414.1 serine/threonine protein kinase [Labilithrix sp.]
MKSVASQGSLPMLVADLADEASRDFLEGVALAEQVAYVPLLAAPVDRSTHSLEVYSPGSGEPLRLLADPVGPPTADGFPLKLRTRQPESAPLLRAANKRPTTLRARHETNHELTDRHTADLEGTADRSAVPSDLVGRRLANGKLEIESLIGGGGVGAVYRARHRELQMPVAVKVLHDTFQSDADFGRRFHAEALAASRLDHPNVTRVLDFGQEPDGLLYLVMEYLDGVGLRALLERDGRFDTERVVRLASQVCAGLGHAHARNIVHKDVKPENLVILQGSDDDGNAMEIVKVCDFGIAQGAVAEETRRFQGTPEYMSPEQCMAAELDARSDVYALGIVMYELITGDVPFTSDDVRAIVQMQIEDPIPPPSHRAANVDPRLEAIILRALAKDRDARFASMRDLRAALRDLLDKPPISLSGQYQRVQLTGMTAPPLPLGDRAPSSSPGWLIHGAALELDSPRSPRSELSSDPSAFMRRLVGTTDPRVFAELVAPLESAIRELAQAHDVETLWRLASTLDILATEGPELPGSRAALSKALLRVLRDPSVLAPVAQRVLAGGDAAGERLLNAAGAFGAHALYSARVRQGDAEARGRFTRALRAIGPVGTPIIRGGLERLADRLGAPGAVSIAEDLLASLPAGHDEALGAIVAAYARSSVPSLSRAAVAALPQLWRERARPIILGLLEHASEEVGIAALGALAELGVADPHTPRFVATVLDRASRRTMRLAAVRTITQARGEARPVSAALIAERLRRCTHLQTIDDAEVALGLARGLVALAPEHAAEVIGEASRSWPPDLRARAARPEA